MKHLANTFPLTHPYKGIAKHLAIHWISAPAGHLGEAQTSDMFYIQVYFTNEDNKIRSVSFQVAEHDGNWHPGNWINQRFASYEGNDFTRKLIPALILNYKETEKMSEEVIDGFFD